MNSCCCGGGQSFHHPASDARQATGRRQPHLPVVELPRRLRLRLLLGPPPVAASLSFIRYFARHTHIHTLARAPISTMISSLFQREDPRKCAMDSEPRPSAPELSSPPLNRGYCQVQRGTNTAAAAAAAAVDAMSVWSPAGPAEQGRAKGGGGAEQAVGLGSAHPASLQRAGVDREAGGPAQSPHHHQNHLNHNMRMNSRGDEFLHTRDEFQIHTRAYDSAGFGDCRPSLFANFAPPPVTGEFRVYRARRGAPAVAGGAQARLREEARLLEIVLVMARTRAAAQSEARVISPPATAPNRPAS